MSTTTLNTRISLKYDTYANWMANDPVLLQGELAVTVVPADAGAVEQEPAILFKVGDGTKKYSELEFTSAKAADIYDWAKQATKPTYAASEITGLADFISGEIQDTNTQYKIEVDESDARTFHLYAKELGGSWIKQNTYTVPAETVYTLVTGDTNGTVKFNGTEVAVAGLKSAAYEDASAFDEAGAAAQVKTDVIGTADDATADTIRGAKKAAAEAQATANAKVASVTATDASVVIGGTTVAPTVGVQVSKDSGNAIELAADGLKVVIPDAAEYTIEKQATAEAGYLATYQLKKDGTQVGASINIPKDYLVKSADLLTVADAGQPYAGAKVGEKYIDFVINTKADDDASHVYLPVNDLVDVYKGGNGIEIDASNNVAIKLGTETNGLGVDASGLKLAPATASNAGAMTAAQASKLDGIAEGAEVNQNAFSIVTAGGQTLEADSKTDTLNIVAGANVTITADPATDTLTIAAKDATKVEKSDTNGNIKVDGAEITVYTHPATHEISEVAGLQDALDAKANDADLAAIAKTGNVNDLVQTAGDYIIFNCGTSSTVI